MPLPISAPPMHVSLLILSIGPTGILINEQLHSTLHCAMSASCTELKTIHAEHLARCAKCLIGCSLSRTEWFMIFVCKLSIAALGCRIVKRAMHGTRLLSWSEVRETYGRELVNLRNEGRYTFLNTLFSVSEAVLYMQASLHPCAFILAPSLLQARLLSLSTTSMDDRADHKQQSVHR